MLHSISSVFDLNSNVRFSHSPWRVADEPGSHDLFPSDGVDPSSRISQMRTILQRRLQSTKVFVHGSVPLHGLRTPGVSRESARHRRVFEYRSGQTLSSRNSRADFSEHSRRCERKTRLANLRGLRAGVDWQRPETLRKRKMGAQPQAQCLRTRLDHHRSLPVVVSMGKIPTNQRRGQAPHAVECAKPHSQFHSNYPRKSSRRQCPRRTGIRAGSSLRDGPRLRRLWSLVQVASERFLFRDSSQKKLPLQTSLLASRGQNNWRKKRSHRETRQLLSGAKLPGTIAQDSLLRRRTEKTSHLSHQQFRLVGNDRRTALQITLASGTLLQMDQTTSPHQGVLRHHRERGENANLDLDHRLRARRDSEKEPSGEPQPAFDSTDFERKPVRESPVAGTV